MFRCEVGTGRNPTAVNQLYLGLRHVAWRPPAVCPTRSEAPCCGLKLHLAVPSAVARDGPGKSGAHDSVSLSQLDPRHGKITAHRRGHVRARCVGVRLPAPSLYFLLRRSFSPKARLLLSTPSSTAPRSAAAPRAEIWPLSRSIMSKLEFRNITMSVTQ